MKRLFQNYKGEVKALNGLILKELCYLKHSDDDIILLWLRTENSFLRIFIDGCYCGIDEYSEDNSKDDIDDDMILIDKTKWIKDLTIKSTFVKAKTLPLISMTIVFTNGSELVFSCNKEEKCSLKKF